MATLYVENVPDDLYEALREKAKRDRRSIAAEVVEILRQMVPTEEDRKKWSEFLEFVKQLRAEKPTAPGPFLTAEEMIREDRER